MPRRALPGSALSKRGEILDQAATLIINERANAYGDAKSNFERIASLWDEVLDTTTPITADQVALCMLLVKVARLAGNPKHLDSWTDIAGYAALGGEVAEAE